jgi:antitoxin component of MazEF toxin-antitoxin module
MDAVIKKIGNSLGVVIPSKIIKNFDLKEGNVIQIPFPEEVQEFETSPNYVEINSKMTRELALLVEKIFLNGRSITSGEIRGFFGIGREAADRIIGFGTVNGWLVREVVNRQNIYKTTIDGVFEAEKVLGHEIVYPTMHCSKCGGTYRCGIGSLCPDCRDAEQLRQQNDLKKSEPEFREFVKNTLDVHKSPVEGNPVLDECRSLAVLDDSDLPKGIVLPERKSMPSCEVERYGEDVPLRAATLNKGFYQANREIEINGALIPIFKKKILGDCPKQLYDEYATVCNILFQQDCKVLDSQTWRFRAGMFLDRNSKILPGLKGKKEKIEFLRNETENVFNKYVEFRLESEKVASGKTENIGGA